MQGGAIGAPFGRGREATEAAEARVGSDILHSTKYVFAVSFFILYVDKLLPPIKSCLACINWSWLPWVTAFSDPRELLFTAGQQVFTALIMVISANLPAMRWVVVHHLGAGGPFF